MLLEYPTKCAECKRVMRPGTEVEWIAEGNNYHHIHAGSCPEKISSGPTAVREVRDPEEKYSLVDCPNCGEVWAIEKGHLKPARFPCCERKEAA